MSVRRRRVSSLVCALVCASACGTVTGAFPPAQRASESPPGDEIFNLQLSKATLRAQGASQALLDTLSASPFQYFRALAEPFKHRTCEAFRDLRWRLPSGAVHGDAHVEQFVVTDENFGLADFDNAGYGPAIVDLVRYAASLHLACREIKGGCDPEQAVTAYFSAYRTALDHPVSRQEPPIVARLRARVGPEPEAWLQWADGLMQPLAPPDEEKVRREWFRFVELMRETTLARPESFYTIQRLGSIEIGLGSALEWKMLIRIAGPTDDPVDDVILEARNHSLPEYRGCVWRPTGGSLNVFLLTSLLAHPLPKVFGVLPNPGGDELPEIWIQSWEPGYRELSLSDIRDQADLNSLATDAGSQLAGHFWLTSPEALRGYQRFTQLRAFELTEQRARDLARSLAAEIVDHWNRFREEHVRNYPTNTSVKSLVMDNLLIDLDREVTSTRRLLERYPPGKGDWRPHDKSRTLSALATHIANIPQHGANILTTPEMDVASRQPQPSKDSAAELLEAFDAGVARLKAAIASADAAKLAEKWTMRAGPRVLASEPRALLMRLMVINHLVHHRAQLGMYLRLLNVPIPGMYGPSADEPV